MRTHDKTFIKKCTLGDKNRDATEILGALFGHFASMKRKNPQPLANPLSGAIFFPKKGRDLKRDLCFRCVLKLCDEFFLHFTIFDNVSVLIWEFAK